MKKIVLVICLLFFSIDLTVSFADENQMSFYALVEENAGRIESFDEFSAIPEGFEIIDGVLFKDSILYKYPAKKVQVEYAVPEGTLGIDSHAFIYKDAERPCFENLYLPQSCINIGFDDDYQNRDLIGPLWYIAKNYHVACDNPKYCSDNGVLFSKDKTQLLIYPSQNGKAEYVIPEGTEQVGAYAFDSCQLLSVACPNTLKTIGEGAFYNSTRLKTIMFGENIKRLDDYAFQYCNSLEKVSFPSALEYIGYSCFHSCWNLYDIVLPKKLSVLCSDAFLGCPIEGILLPASLTSIGSEIFGNDEDVSFSVYENSYAQEWCLTNEYNYSIMSQEESVHSETIEAEKLVSVYASAESIVPSIPINKNASQEYQLIYLASLCGINVTREGEFFENVNMVRAVTSNIDAIVSEAFILGFSEEKVHLVANYDFADTASITFASEGIDIEEILPYCSTDNEQNQEPDTYDFILNGKRLFLQYSAIKEIYKNSVTTKSFLTIQSPFASDDLNEISISLFDLDDSFHYHDERSAGIIHNAVMTVDKKQHGCFR